MLILSSKHLNCTLLEKKIASRTQNNCSFLALIFLFTGQSHDMLYESNNCRSNPEEAMQKETFFYTKHFQGEQTKSFRQTKCKEGERLSRLSIVVSCMTEPKLQTTRMLSPSFFSLSDSAKVINVF